MQFWRENKLVVVLFANRKKRAKNVTYDRCFLDNLLLQGTSFSAYKTTYWTLANEENVDEKGYFENSKKKAITHFSFLCFYEPIYYLFFCLAFLLRVDYAGFISYAKDCM